MKALLKLVYYTISNRIFIYAVTIENITEIYLKSLIIIARIDNELLIELLKLILFLNLLLFFQTISKIVYTIILFNIHRIKTYINKKLLKKSKFIFGTIKTGIPKTIVYKVNSKKIILEGIL